MREGDFGDSGDLFDRMHKARKHKNELFEKLKVVKEEKNGLKDQRQELVNLL